MNKNIKLPLNYTFVNHNISPFDISTATVIDDEGHLFDMKIVDLEACKRGNKPNVDHVIDWITFHELKSYVEINESISKEKMDAYYINPYTNFYLSPDKDFLYLIRPKVSEQLRLKKYILGTMKDLKDRNDYIKYAMYQMLYSISKLHATGHSCLLLSLDDFTTSKNLEITLDNFGLDRIKSLARTYDRDANIRIDYIDYMSLDELFDLHCEDRQSLDIWRLGISLVKLILGNDAFSPRHRDIPHQLEAIIRELGLKEKDIINIFGTKISATFFELFRYYRNKIDSAEVKAKTIEEKLREINVDEPIISLINELLNIDANKRLTANQVLHNDLFKEYLDEESYPLIERVKDIDISSKTENNIISDFLCILSDSDENTKQTKKSRNLLKEEIRGMLVTFEEYISYNFFYDGSYEFGDFNAENPEQLVLSKAPESIAELGLVNVLKISQYLQNPLLQQECILKLIETVTFSPCICQKLLSNNILLDKFREVLNVHHISNNKSKLSSLQNEFIEKIDQHKDAPSCLKYLQFLTLHKALTGKFKDNSSKDQLFNSALKLHLLSFLFGDEFILQQVVDFNKHSPSKI